MKHCYEFFNVYKAFRTFVKTQHFAVIKCFRCDLGREYTSNKFLELLADELKSHLFSVHFSD